MIILKLYFFKNSSWKIKVLQIFGLSHQEVDLWFTNHEPYIPATGDISKIFNIKNVYFP